MHYKIYVHDLYETCGLMIRSGVATMKFLEADALNGAQQLYCILFWAPWAEPAVFAEQLLDDQAEDFSSISFGKAI
jgi:hypothetical protein